MKLESKTARQSVIRAVGRPVGCVQQGDEAAPQICDLHHSLLPFDDLGQVRLVAAVEHRRHRRGHRDGLRLGLFSSTETLAAPDEADRGRIWGGLWNRLAAPGEVGDTEQPDLALPAHQVDADVRILVKRIVVGLAWVEETVVVHLIASILAAM